MPYLHNNYATLPVVFIMLSNHFPYTYSHSFGWLMIIALFGIGMWIRRAQQSTKVLINLLSAL
ncbi:urate hydroxylase PuuD (plasmid) [Pseudoalteromonas espejiana]